MYVYMMVTKDKYQLPVAFADSCKELSEMTGVNEGKILSAIYKSEKRHSKKSRWIKVWIED